MSVAIPLALYVAIPALIEAFTGTRPAKQTLLIIACLVYCISWYIPSPLIEGKDTSFSTHVIGGGIFCGFLWLYAIQHLKWKLSVATEALSLYALVSAFGVANELFELLIVKLRIIRISPSDTWWDLLANTLGALVFWLCYRVYKNHR
jgi:hypothetical protein